MLKFKKMFGNTKLGTFKYKLQLDKQDLKACTGRLRYERTKKERFDINRRFAIDPKSVYRQMRQSKFKITKVPQKLDLQTYWANIWGCSKNSTGTQSDSVDSATHTAQM